MEGLTWFARLVVLADLLFATAWSFAVLPYVEPIASGEFALHRYSIWAAIGLTVASVLIGLSQLWIDPLRVFDAGPIPNAIVMFLAAAAVVMVEWRFGG
jgi:hypothetical protein